MSVRCCVSCKHFSFDEGSPGYSQYTPGSDVSMGCDKNLWPQDAMEFEGSFCSAMELAETCPEFLDRYGRP